MSNPWWPLFDLTITTGDLVMRAMTEADLDVLASSLPDDLELNPAATRYSGLPDRTNRGIVTYQGYWSAFGSWTVDAWALPLVAIRDGVLIGTQTLEGTDFVRLRVVDSASYLLPEMRGKGFGKQMRRAVLSLAFDHMGAEMAISAAWHDNPASLGVSRSLGYEPNGLSRHGRDDGADWMEHVRLMRQTWLASGLSTGIEIEGFDACRPLFGLT